MSSWVYLAGLMAMLKIKITNPYIYYKMAAFLGGFFANILKFNQLFY